MDSINQLFPRQYPRLGFQHLTPTPTLLLFQPTHLVKRQATPAPSGGSSTSGSSSDSSLSQSSTSGSDSSSSSSSSSSSESSQSSSSSSISSCVLSLPLLDPALIPQAAPQNPVSRPPRPHHQILLPHLHLKNRPRPLHPLLLSQSPHPFPQVLQSHPNNKFISPSPSWSNFTSAQTTLTSTIVTEVNGVPTTLVTTIPTTLSNAPSSPSSSSTRSIIIGCSIGGVALAAILVSLALFCRRQNYRKLRVFSRNHKTRSMLLEGEDFDDTDIGPPLQRYTDCPASMSSQSQYSTAPLAPSPTGYSNPMAQVAPIAARTSPHLLVRASESGSIFREAVWPPPGERSRFVDPLLSSSSQVDLGRIVDDVMGGSTTQGSRPPSSFGATMHHQAASSMTSFSHLRQDTAESSEDYRRHSRATSQTGLLPDRSDSPFSPPRGPPLFVANASPASPATPPVTSPKNWLERSPHPVRKMTEDEGAVVQMGEAL